jgi:hypothetical protein
MNSSSTNSRHVGIKGLTVALASCIIGLTVMIFAFGLDSNSEKPERPKEKSSKVELAQKTTAVSNFALGNVVVVAPELGLTVKTPDQTKVEPSRIAAKIEPQLLSIRKLYRTESEKSPRLMGDVLLQLTVGSSGAVVHVSELDSHLVDKDFRRAITAEAGKWEFNDLAPNGTMINCPLLFVREGMDIKTIVKWEKTLGLFEHRTASNESRRNPTDGNKNTASGNAVNKSMRSEPRAPKEPPNKRSADVFENSQGALPVEIEI